MPNESHFLKILQQFFNDYLPKARGASPQTIRSYKMTFTQLITFLFENNRITADQISFSTFSPAIIMDFLDWLEEHRNCSATTRNLRRAALASFANYAKNLDIDAATIFYTSVCATPRKKCPQKTRTIMTSEEVKILLALPSSKTKIGMRDKVLLSVMYASGVRAQEICNLLVKDVRTTSNGQVSLDIVGKGRKYRRILIGNIPSQMLLKYIEYRGIKDKPECFVFPSTHHPKMSVSCVEEIFKKYVKLARQLYPDKFNGSSYSPHSMRHTFASHMLEADVSIVAIGNILGHEQLETTQRYARLSQKTVDKYLRAWNEKWMPSINGINNNLETSARDMNIPAFLR